MEGGTQVEVIAVPDIGITAILVRGELNRTVRDQLYQLVPASAQFRASITLAKRWKVTAVLSSESWAFRKWGETPPTGLKLAVVV